MPLTCNAAYLVAVFRLERTFYLPHYRVEQPNPATTIGWDYLKSLSRASAAQISPGYFIRGSAHTNYLAGDSTDSLSSPVFIIQVVNNSVAYDQD